MKYSAPHIVSLKLLFHINVSALIQVWLWQLAILHTTWRNRFKTVSQMFLVGWCSQFMINDVLCLTPLLWNDSQSFWDIFFSSSKYVQRSLQNFFQPWVLFAVSSSSQAAGENIDQSERRGCRNLRDKTQGQEFLFSTGYLVKMNS